MEHTESHQLATFGSGCFWCTEAVYKRVKGVEKVTSGYSGGKTANPTYEQIHAQPTGHAEVIQLEFDPTQVTYEQLVEIFFGTHNPTTRNRQGNDVGEEYRSVIFYHSEEQKKTAEKIKHDLDEQHIFPGPIVTDIEPYTAFYQAEAYHQEYYDRNPDQAYCQYVIDPKLAKLRQKFAPLLKPE